MINSIGPKVFSMTLNQYFDQVIWPDHLAFMERARPRSRVWRLRRAQAWLSRVKPVAEVAA